MQANSINRRLLLTRLIGALLLVAVWPQTPAWAGEGLTIELNKLEQANGACRVYLLFENTTESAFSSLNLDLVMFGQDGVISRRLAVEGGPLSKGKTSVKSFEITGLACAGIDRVLLNDVISCRDASGDRDNCIEQVETKSLSAVAFFK